tara:strand:- start:38 stop:277 length:240 start_codon:yes stop_codon:yes gene_type:complete
VHASIFSSVLGVLPQGKANWNLFGLPCADCAYVVANGVDEELDERLVVLGKTSLDGELLRLELVLRRPPLFLRRLDALF